MPAPGNSAWKRKRFKDSIPYEDRVRRFTFGRFLKENREKFGLTAIRTAQYLDLSIDYYWLMERGHQNPPTKPAPWMARAAKLFDVGIDEVYFHLGITDTALIEQIGEHLWKFPDLANHIRKLLANCEPNPVISLPEGFLSGDKKQPPAEETAQ